MFLRYNSKRRRRHRAFVSGSDYTDKIPICDIALFVKAMLRNISGNAADPSFCLNILPFVSRKRNKIKKERSGWTRGDLIFFA